MNIIVGHYQVPNTVSLTSSPSFAKLIIYSGVYASYPKNMLYILYVSGTWQGIWFSMDILTVDHTNWGSIYNWEHTSILFLSTFARFSPASLGLFSRFRLRGTQGARLYTTAQLWGPAGFRGACSGRSKSRILASNRRIAFRPARADQVHANPQKTLYFHFFTSLCCWVWSTTSAVKG